MKKLLATFKWMTVLTATWTMLATPVAMGAEAQRVSKSQMQAAVDQLGLNRQMTIGEFYQKNKSLFPDRIKKELEPFFMANKNMMMPSFEVISSKTTSGEEIPTLRVSANGELLNIQWFGEKNRLAKFQNTNLTEVDMVNFDDMFTRIVAGDEKFRKQISPVKSNLKTKFTAFRSFRYPKVTKEQWATMSANDKANYVVNFRSLYIDAKDVLAIKAKNKTAKKKYSLNLLESHPYFAALFLGSEAHAARPYFTAKSCVVAGYVSVYQVRADGREVCSIERAKQKYANDELYTKAQALCGADQIACNPNIYGAPDNGRPTCLTPGSDPDFQRATHFNGPCDSASRLQKTETEIPFLNNRNLSKGRYDEANLLLQDEQRKARFKQEQTENQELTERYLIGVLKLKGKLGADVTRLDPAALDDNMRTEIEKIRSEFETKIAEAVQTCREVANEESRSENNYWPACDQLHRRFLFISELYAKKCEQQSLPPTPNQLTCSCPAPSAPAASAPAPSVPAAASSPVPSAPAPVVSTPAPSAPGLPPVRVPVPQVPPVSAPAPSAPVVSVPAPSAPVVVPPGASCPQPAPAVTATAPAPVPSSPSPGSGQSCDMDPTDSSCVCPAGSSRSQTGSRDQIAYTCSGSGNTSGKDKNDCNFFCKMWKGVKTIAPFAIAGVAAYLIFKTLAPKKPALVPAADLCPGTNTPPPCAQACTPPLKLQSSGACSCDGCPPGQSADSTCTCSSAPVNPSNPSTMLCPDSVTRAADLAACPDYPCWNGSTYKNPMNCPAAPASTTNGVNTGN